MTTPTPIPTRNLTQHNSPTNSAFASFNKNHNPLHEDKEDILTLINPSKGLLNAADGKVNQ